MVRNFELGLQFAQLKDEKDCLKRMRNHFIIPENMIYMDGNSLGLSPKEAQDTLAEANNDWLKYGIGIWDIKDSKYFSYGTTLGARISKLIGAKENEVVVMGSTTLNLHSAMATFYKPTKERYKIIIDDINFPTDRYAIESQIKLHDIPVETALKVVPSKKEGFIDEDAIIDAMSDDVAMIILPAVLYRSAQLVDMKKITEVAHEKNIFVGWDLCHAIGAIEMDFSDIQPDFAVWCNYKYLNGGPGATGGFYINEKHFSKDAGLAGWWGNKTTTQFELNQNFEHNKSNAGGWQTGTPSIFSMAALEGSLTVIEDAGLANIREKSLDITAYLMYLIDQKLTQYGYSIGNSREDSKRGGHVCLQHEEAYRICKSLKTHGVIPDYRDPDVIRLAPIALYTAYSEVYKLVEILESIVRNKEFEKISKDRTLVV